MNNIEKVVRILEKKNRTIATMESCTGGYLVNAITNIPGASKVLKYSAITYNNDFKIKMGVQKDIITTYGVYSMETARDMAKNISVFANSDYGVGITGIIDKEAYICIYEKDSNNYHNLYITLQEKIRMENKNIIVNNVINKLIEILRIDN